MHKYLLDHPSLRSSPVDFTELRDMVKEFDERKSRLTATSASIKSSTSKGKGKGRKAVQLEAADNDDELTGYGNDSDPVKRTKSQKLFLQLGITQAKFLNEVDKIRESMKDFPFTQNDRVASHYSRRVVTTGGLTWNPESKRYKRDWESVAIAGALEVNIVGKYRSLLLKTKRCPGACILRGIFVEKLTEKTQPIIMELPVTGEELVKQSWTFPDNIEVTDDLDVVEVVNVWDNTSHPSLPLQSPQPSQKRKVKPRVHDTNCCDSLLYCEGSGRTRHKERGSEGEVRGSRYWQQ